jgi:hypothetical protein
LSQNDRCQCGHKRFHHVRKSPKNTPTKCNKCECQIRMPTSILYVEICKTCTYCKQEIQMSDKELEHKTHLHYRGRLEAFNEVLEIIKNKKEIDYEKEFKK